MRQIELTSKLVVALISIVVVFSAMTVPSVVAQSTTSPPIRANSVTSGSIKDGEVKTQDLANEAVTTEKIADGAINLNIHEVDGEVLTLNPGVGSTAFADCPDGEILTGGGFLAGYPIQVTLSKQRANGDNAWAVTGVNEASTDRDMQAFAYCLDPTIP
jgi:hypothetical protein